jgi:hypothetical protein
VLKVAFLFCPTEEGVKSSNSDIDGCGCKSKIVGVAFGVCRMRGVSLVGVLAVVDALAQGVDLDEVWLFTLFFGQPVGESGEVGLVCLDGAGCESFGLFYDDEFLSECVEVHVGYLLFFN